MKKNKYFLDPFIVFVWACIAMGSGFWGFVIYYGLKKFYEFLKNLNYV